MSTLSSPTPEAEPAAPYPPELPRRLKPGKSDDRLPWNRLGHPLCRNCERCPGVIHLNPNPKQILPPWLCYTCGIREGVYFPPLSLLEAAVSNLQEEMTTLTLLVEVAGWPPKYSADLRWTLSELAWHLREAQVERDIVVYLNDVGMTLQTMECTCTPLIAGEVS